MRLAPVLSWLASQVLSLSHSCGVFNWGMLLRSQNGMSLLGKVYTIKTWLIMRGGFTFDLKRPANSTEIEHPARYMHM